MTKQEIAVALSKIDWVSAECDSIEVWSQLEVLKEEIIKMDRNEIVRFFYSVMKANYCAASHPDVFHGMLQFRYINND